MHWHTSLGKNFSEKGAGRRVDNKASMLLSVDDIGMSL